MSKVDQYRRGLELCLANAAKASFAELRAVWQTIGMSYAFLAELEAMGAIRAVSIAPALHHETRRARDLPKQRAIPSALPLYF
jgi:hypothetical protein